MFRTRGGHLQEDASELAEDIKELKINILIYKRCILLVYIV